MVVHQHRTSHNQCENCAENYQVSPKPAFVTIVPVEIDIALDVRCLEQTHVLSLGERGDEIHLICNLVPPGVPDEEKINVILNRTISLFSRQLLRATKCRNPANFLALLELLSENFLVDCVTVPEIGHTTGVLYRQSRIVRVELLELFDIFNRVIRVTQILCTEPRLEQWLQVDIESYGLKEPFIDQIRAVVTVLMLNQVAQKQLKRVNVDLLDGLIER